jgi:hypothetical protein
MKSLAGICSALLFSGCSTLGIRTTPEPPHEVTRRDGPIEVREYRPQVLAETVVQAAHDEAGSQAFRRLAGYIFGGNRAGRQIAMTAPVLQKEASQSIDMTAPVLQRETAEGWWMAFILPAEISLDSAPEPTDPLVELREVPGRTIATLRYGGLNSPEKMERYAADLGRWLDEQGFRPLGPPTMASYDPPWTLWFLRRNEVQIEIERRPPT